jgi:hypothetical protein
MKRRESIAARRRAVWPLAARAQQAASGAGFPRYLVRNERGPSARFTAAEGHRLAGAWASRSSPLGRESNRSANGPSSSPAGRRHHGRRSGRGFGAIGNHDDPDVYVTEKNSVLALGRRPRPAATYRVNFLGESETKRLNSCISKFRQPIWLRLSTG